MIHGRYSSYTNGKCRCSECTKAAGDYRRAWVKANPDKVNATARHRRSRIREMLHAIKLEKGCADCGYRVHAAALDFDHVQGEKSFNVAQSSYHSWVAVRREVSKCEVVCANCHRIRTWNRNREETDEASADAGGTP